MTEIKYVWMSINTEGIEVKSTGREAVKTIGGRKTIEQKLIEITPTDELSASWKKWVAKEDLWEIIE